MLSGVAQAPETGRPKPIFMAPTLARCQGGPCRCGRAPWARSRLLGHRERRAFARHLGIGADRGDGRAAEPGEVGAAVLLVLAESLRRDTRDHVAEVPDAGPGPEQPVTDVLALLAGERPERVEPGSERRHHAVELRGQVAQEL